MHHNALSSSIEASTTSTEHGHGKAALRLKVLVVDDQPEMAQIHAQILHNLGCDSLIETDSPKVEERLSQNADIDLALIDIRMPHMNGITLLNRLRVRFPHVGVVVATVINDIDEAVRATKLGAYNYLLKPLNQERLREVLQSYMAHHQVGAGLSKPMSNLITSDKNFQDVFRKVKLFAEAGVDVLIQGETGTGKDLIAHLIHASGPRARDKFVAINMAALSSTLFESELFGHSKGAFTGALKDKDGYLGKADTGSLFLDEIGEVSMDLQKKLLRVLQSRTYYRVGDTVEKRFHAQIIAATNRNLQQDIQNKLFREDLYFRLASHHITLPPLRERQGDIELLSDYFLKKYCAQYGRSIRSISLEALQQLKAYRFPGNVRELEGIVSSAVLLESSDCLQVSSLPEHVLYQEQAVPPDDLESAKYHAIMKVVIECQGNQTKAANKLGIARGTLNRLLKEYRQQNRLFPDDGC